MPKPACAFGVLLLILTEPIAACEWGPWTVPVALAAGETISNITLKVSDGTLLVFRISDAQRLIQDTAAACYQTVDWLFPTEISGAALWWVVVSPGQVCLGVV